MNEELRFPSTISSAIRFNSPGRRLFHAPIRRQFQFQAPSVSNLSGSDKRWSALKPASQNHVWRRKIEHFLSSSWGTPRRRRRRRSGTWWTWSGTWWTWERWSRPGHRRWMASWGLLPRLKHGLTHDDRRDRSRHWTGEEAEPGTQRTTTTNHSNLLKGLPVPKFLLIALRISMDGWLASARWSWPAERNSLLCRRRFLGPGPGVRFIARAAFPPSGSRRRAS